MDINFFFFIIIIHDKIKHDMTNLDKFEVKLLLRIQKWTRT
jgi:hypothetical protein